MLSPSIWKAYDIRGIYPDEIDEASAERIGRAAARFFKGKRVCVGYDHRSSSPSLREALVRGITSVGVDVLDIGRVTTPCAYFASHYLATPTLMITASHNPPEYNGIKFCHPHAVPIGKGSGLEDIRDLAQKDERPDGASKGRVERESVTRAYWKHLESRFHAKSSHRIVIDTGSAMGIEDLAFWNDLRRVDVVDALYETYGLPCPHEANPMKAETLRELGERVVAHKAEFGIAYDGDADRVGIVDEKGAPVRADLLAALIVPIMLKRYPESKVVLDVRVSRALIDVIQKHGGVPTFAPVGHVNMKRVMQETGAVFGAELSAHLYYHTPYIAEMGPLPALDLIEVLEYQGKPLSTLIAQLPEYYHSGERNFYVEDMAGAIARITEEYKDGIASTLDGVRIDYPNWWFSVRASNTESLLRLNVESRSPTETDAHVEELVELIAEFGGRPEIPRAHSR